MRPLLGGTAGTPESQTQLRHSGLATFFLLEMHARPAGPRDQQSLVGAVFSRPVVPAPSLRVRTHRGAGR
jgi:hypothetical protein